MYREEIMDNLVSILDNVKKIVKDAALIMEQQNFDIESKGGIGNYVTTKDKQVEAFLRTNLNKLYPEITFIGEESDIQDYQAMTCWIVDPIDGTANFIHDLKASAISVGLIHNGESVLGVVYNPYMDEMFHAIKGQGAFLNNKPIQVSDRKFENSLYATAFCLYKREYAQICQEIMSEVYSKCEDFRRFGTAAIELSQLAAGRLDLYFEMRLSPWDHAAAAVIIKEAGGFVGTLYRKEDASNNYIFTRPIPVFAANTKENFDLLRGILTKYIDYVPYTD